jgi:hypothetical protein
MAIRIPAAKGRKILRKGMVLRKFRTGLKKIPPKPGLDGI